MIACAPEFTPTESCDADATRPAGSAARPYRVAFKDGNCLPALPGVAPMVTLYHPDRPIPLPDSAPAAGLAASRSWYWEGRPITFRDDGYVAWGWNSTTPPTAGGRPRIEVIYCGAYDGVPIYLQPPLTPQADYIYIPLDRAGLFRGYAEVSSIQYVR